MSDLLKPIDAARLAGVSYPTLKQWIYSARLSQLKLLVVIIGLRAARSSA
jgi:hypothetical protein